MLKACLHGFLHLRRGSTRDLTMLQDPPLFLLTRSEDDTDWETRVHRFVRLQRLLECASVDVKVLPPAFEQFINVLIYQSNLVSLSPQREHIPHVVDYMSEVLRLSNNHCSAQSRNVKYLSSHFERAENKDAFLCSSSLFADAGPPSTTPADSFSSQQLSAKLHVLYGVPIDAHGRRPHPTHPYARARVYDLRKYTKGSLWGPFLEDGSVRVDWEKLESILVVLAYNMRKFHIRSRGLIPIVWHRPFTGLAPHSFMSPPHDAQNEEEDDLFNAAGKDSRLDPDLVAQDPYGITGVWMRVS